MKKLILTVLASFLTLTLVAQTTIHSTAIRIADWNETTENWDWNGEWKDQNINFLLQGNVILVNDKANSTYTMLDEGKLVDNYFEWKAIDEGRLKCTFMMSVEADENNYQYIMVVYSDRLFKYVYEL